MLDAGQWRQRTLITIQLARRNISRAEADLQKTMKKGWFSRKEKLQAEDKMRSQQETNRREKKERRMLTE